MKSFDTLGLSDKTLQVLEELKFETPTEIQEKAIPFLLGDDRNFVGLAQTGTGKTAAFGLPLLELLEPDFTAIQALILAPTRELGQQIAEQLAIFSKYHKKVKTLAVYGGAAISNQMRDLKKNPQVIIATPGRLIDLIKRRAIKLDNLKYLILDEADEMLNMGFKDELDEIMSYTPDSKKTWLFSATMPREIQRIVKSYMDNPIEVKVQQQGEIVNANIEHQFCIVSQADKTEALMRLMDMSPDKRGVVFCRTKRDTQNLAEALLQKNYKADALHGDLTQAQRDRVMKRFKDGSLNVLIATDVAARGIDVNDLAFVVHFTLPDDASYYTHRSGRTARAGAKGVSLAFISSRDTHKINRLQKELNITFHPTKVPSGQEVKTMRIEKWAASLLETPIKGNKLDPKLNIEVQEMFAELSKEDLVAKLLINQLKQMGATGGKDLNQSADGRDGRGGRGGDGGSKRRGNRDGGGRGRDRNRRDGGGGRGRRDGGGGYRGSSDRRDGDGGGYRGRDRRDGDGGGYRSSSDRREGAGKAGRKKSYGGDRNEGSSRGNSSSDSFQSHFKGGGKKKD